MTQQPNAKGIGSAPLDGVIVAAVVAMCRLPTVRRRLEGAKGTLIVGAMLGTLLWVALRALLPTQGPPPMGVLAVVVAALALSR